MAYKTHPLMSSRLDWAKMDGHRDWVSSSYGGSEETGGIKGG